MKKVLLACWAAVLMPSSFGQAIPTPQLQVMYESHQWFSLRDATEAAKVPLFYRAAAEAAFNQVQPAQKHLNAVIKAAPRSHDAYEAHELLASLYFRNGMYREANIEIEALLAEKPNAEDLKNERPLFSALSHSDQIVSRRRASTISMLMEDGNLYLPFTVDGKVANYAFDSGANLSIMSESEAKRLGLTIQSVDTRMGDSSGAQIGLRVAVAKELILGGLHLQNVAFAVLPDTQEPFVDLPDGKRGLVGIPVLIAMQTMRWEPKGTFAFGFAPKHKNISASNLSFDQSFPVTQIEFQHKSLEFTVDTGAEKTVLSPPFAKEFPDLMRASGQTESHKLTGVAGSSSYDSVLLPSVTLQVGSHDVSLAPAHVLVKQSTETSSWAAGNLGIDLLNQAHDITFDFHAMALSLH
jgi:predicted aspartyl protease